MMKLLRAEFRRLFKNKLFWLGIAVMLGLGIWATVARYYDSTHLVGMGYDTPDGLLFIAAMLGQLINAEAKLDREALMQKALETVEKITVKYHDDASF